jgi:hypothetical protein
LILYAASGAIGAMLDEAALSDVFRSLTLLPLLGALAVVPTAMLRRDGRRGPFIAAAAAGLAAGGGIAIALAWAGAGPWSLVAQIIAQRFLECTVLWGMAEERIGISWSRRHFAELVCAIDLRALAASAPNVLRYGPCLLVGLLLGPTATGLYFLASRFNEAALGVFLAKPTAMARKAIPEIARRACQPILPAVIGSAVLAIAMPSLLDLRWWGAVLPAQILLLGAIPAAVIFVRTACTKNDAADARWQAAQALTGVAVVALVAPCGLVTVAVTLLIQATAIALASLWQIRRNLGARWRDALAAAAKPCGGAAAAGFLLFLLADPVGLALDSVTALCLLIASGWLCYLVIRGETLAPERPAPPPRRRLSRVNPA